ncbi:MAG: hypothetical protein AB1942_15345 [Pseudomonadota bacterium]
MSRALMIASLGLAAGLAACTPSLGPPPPGGPPPRPAPSRPPPPPMGGADFSAGDFGWSQRPGQNVIAGRVIYRQGPTRYTCAGASVVLTPETRWSARRMAALYGSTERAALPADEVRARTPNAPAGDAGPYVKRTTCDDADQFAFGGLADGAWYAITVARPAAGNAPTVALMRRIVVRGGRLVNVTL